MKNRRALVLLSLVFLALVGAHVALRISDRAAGRAAARRTLVAVGRDYTRITIARRGERATVLVKSPTWKLSEPYAANVDERAVKRIVDALAMTPVDDVLSDAELLRFGRSRADFQLDDPELSVTLTDAAGAEQLSFGLRTASGTCVYAAVSGTDAVFAVPTNVYAAVNVPANDFRRHSLFLSDVAEVASLQIRRPDGKPLSVVRDGERWRIGDEPASEQKVRSFLDAVLSAEAERFVWPVGQTNEAESVSAALLSGYGLDAEKAVTVTLRGVDGTDDRVTFGGDYTNGVCYALVQNGSAIVTVPVDLRQRSCSGEAEFTDARLFPYETLSVASFTLTADGTDYVVAREAGGGWRLDAPVSAPADAEVASTVLERILSLTGADQRPEGLRVSVSTNAEPVTVAAARVLGELRPDDLRAHDVLTVDPALVKRLVATPPGDGASDAVVYDRDRRVWNVEKSVRKGAADMAGLTALLAALNPLKAERTEKLKVDVADLASYGLDRPYCSVAIDLDQANAVRRNILVGKRAGTDGARFATVGSSDAVFVLSEATVRMLQIPLVSD